MNVRVFPSRRMFLTLESIRFTTSLERFPMDPRNHRLVEAEAEEVLQFSTLQICQHLGNTPPAMCMIYFLIIRCRWLILSKG